MCPIKGPHTHTHTCTYLYPSILKCLNSAQHLFLVPQTPQHLLTAAINWSLHDSSGQGLFLKAHSALSLHPVLSFTSVFSSSHCSILFSHYSISFYHLLTHTHTPLSGTVLTSPSPQRLLQLHCTAAVVLSLTEQLVHQTYTHTCRKKTVQFLKCVNTPGQ